MRQGGSDRDVMVEVCRRLAAKGFVAATDGNVSIRLAGGTILTTRSAIAKGMVTAEDLVEITASGESVGSSLKPSTEAGMHLFIYRERPDIHAIVHAHPVYATGFATARIPLSGCLFPEVIIGLGSIPLATYATPSTPEVAESLAPYVRTSDAILLANHGVVTYGKDLWDAYFKMEKVEHAAQITFVARMLGGEHRLGEEDVDKLRAISRQSYGKEIAGQNACNTADPGEGDSRRTSGPEDFRNIVKQMLLGE